MAASSLDLGVVQLILSSDSVRSAKVRVSTPNMVAGKLETATHQILPGQKPLRFDWKHRIPVYPGSHAWEGLENALGQARSRPGAATIAFAVIDVDKGTEVAKATVDLARLSSYGAHEAEAASQTLNVNDAHGRAHGQLIVQVRALEAVRLVLKGPQVAEDIRKAFREFDRDGSGDIDASELRAALQRLGLGNVDSASAKAILSKYDGDSNNALDISEFDRLVKDLRSYQSGSGSGSGKSPAKGSPSRGSAGLEAKVRATFDAFDADKSGDIDVTELQKALQHLGLNASSSSVEQVLRRYSGGTAARPTLSKTLSYEQFFSLVQDLQKFQGASNTSAAPASPSRAAHGSGSGAADPHVIAAFRQFDTDGSGDIDASELQPALRVLGLKADSAGALQVVKSYASAGTSSLTLPQFEKLVKDLEKYQGGASPLRRTSLARTNIDKRIRDAFSK